MVRLRQGSINSRLMTVCGRLAEAKLACIMRTNHCVLVKLFVITFAVVRRNEWTLVKAPRELQIVGEDLVAPKKTMFASSISIAIAL